MLLNRKPPLPTELICFSEEACAWLGRIHDWSSQHSRVMLLGLRAGTTVTITDMALVEDMAHKLEAAGGAIRPPLFKEGCRRGYAYALEKHTPYRHLGWLQHRRSDDPIEMPSERSVDSLVLEGDWQIYDTTQQHYPLMIYVGRKRKKQLQIRAFEIRYGETVEVLTSGFPAP